jgi:hypothetical protein
MENKILSKKEFEFLHDKKCKFRHMYEDQERCLSCYGNPIACPKIEEAWQEYKKQLGIPDSLLIMMGVQI